MPGNQRTALLLALSILFFSLFIPCAHAVPLPGGTLDPLTIPKYVAPLVIPPVMPSVGADNYAIAVRQFKQQILPAFDNAANPTGLAPTTVWSYGNAADNVPATAPSPTSTFNYPALTIETVAGTPVNVRWINGLVDNTGAFLPHLLPVDQTLHWANPPATGCVMGMANSVDCRTDNAATYTGPVPLITHVHGAHVDPHSDGYPQAWFLPAANNIPAGYSMKGSFFDDATGANPGNLGYADFRYRNDQAAATLWYHDHALGMTRNNVYAGPAGFWLVRGGPYEGATDNVAQAPAVLPGPAPVAGDALLDLNTPGNAVRNAIREIPIAIQDRSFNADGSLWYPSSRVSFDGFNGPYTGSNPISTDIAPIANVEAFFNTMVVNGGTWPVLNVAPALYRFRLLNGCNSRMLNLSLRILDNNTELPFYQIGAEQGFLPQVVQIKTGYITPLPGDGTFPAPIVNAASAEQALLMGNAERADVIVDFRGLPDNTVIRMLNTGADSPFGGFPVGLAVADDNTTGQVMQFIVDSTVTVAADSTTTPPENLVLNAAPALGAATVTRNVSLNEDESAQVCNLVDSFGIPIYDNTGLIQYVYAFPTPFAPGALAAACSGLAIPGGAPAGSSWVPFGPKSPQLGTVNLTNPGAPAGIILAWDDTSGTSVPTNVTMADNVTIKVVNVTENPQFVAGVAPIEEWDIYNFTMDAHPIHLHLVDFQVVSRTLIPGQPGPLVSGGIVQATEAGFKDTVIAYPGEITKVKARFDITGLYVWHCHIVEHEDNEMMRPFVVSPSAATSVTLTPSVASPQAPGTQVTFTAQAAGGSGNYQYKFRLWNGSAWSTVKDYSVEGNSWIWDTTGIADNSVFTVVVYARNRVSSASVETNRSVSYRIRLPIAPATNVSLTPTASSPQAPGASVTFDAVATGGSGSYEYKFRLWNGTAWSTVKEYTVPGASWTWDTTGITSGSNFTIVVYARSAGSTASVETYRSMSFLIQNPLAAATNVTLTPTASSPQAPGASVTFDAVATGGTGSYEYKFRLWNGTAWSTVKDYTDPGASWTWDTTGITSGSNFTVVVYARSAGSGASVEAYRSMSFLIQNPLAAATSVSLDPSASSPQAPGTQVTFTSVALGGTGTYQYKFRLWNGTSWSDVKSYTDPGNSWIWDTTGITPGSSFTIAVYARSAGSAASVEAVRSIRYTIQ
jgi:FtsP/CotA-like multicopper oxidase with cupredoxin domain/regulation of enolase protein 1 (concanavalin A-like superfamily)